VTPNRKRIAAHGARLAATLTAAVAAALAAAGTGSGAVGRSADYYPSQDMNSMYSTTQYTGATAWWDAGYTGKGIDVAVIDTGFAPVQGLNDPAKVIYGPDLSLESQAPNLTRVDTNGHGTFMAGLIAGHDDSLTSPYSSAPASAYRGIAPDARIVALKVGIADGGVDVSQVVAAIDWVVQHRSDNGLNIRVINLSYGTNSTQSYTVDPLAYAAEQAWKKGIVVVAAAGNTGYQKGNGAPGLADPAYDPYVIAVGASDSMGTATTTDDTVAPFSASSAGCGGACKNPDFVAPGAHLQGLRVPGSWIDLNNPDGRLADRYFRGSGTSESAAIVSGAAALVLQKYPWLQPDQVKKYFATYADHLAGCDAAGQGAGEIQLGKMLTKTPSSYLQKSTNSIGLGSLDAARGQDRLTMDGVVLSGEQDIFGNRFDSTVMAALEASGSSWTGGLWNGNSWSGNSWSGNSWSGSTWSGNSWTGNSWSSLSWSGNSWSGNSWSGNSWSGTSWSGNSWSGNSWSGGSWAAAFWG